MRTLHIALAALALAGSAMAQESPAPQPAATAGVSTSLGASRAEILADLEMWHRAGMTYLTDRETGVQSAEYRQGLERYRQLRAGPAFLEAVARLEQQHTITRK